MELRRVNLPTFVDEGIGLYGDVGNPPNGAQELYRFYNEATGAHFFTVSEDDRIVSRGVV